MKQTAEMLRTLAKHHREVARTAHQKEFIEDLLRLAEQCEAEADALAARTAKEPDKYG
jgi:hypothetical protein